MLSLTKYDIITLQEVVIVMVEIKGVIPGSVAEELHINKGDQLIRIDDREINDYIDYQYGIAADFFVLTIKKKMEISGILRLKGLLMKFSALSLMGLYMIN